MEWTSRRGASANERGAGARLDAAFYRRGTLEVARDLLGRILCRRLPGGDVLRGRIVEVEAYDGPRDRASHAFRGRTPRNAPMFEAGGIAYVYFVYGMHHCLNVVTGPEGFPAAVLLRAAESPNGSNATGPARLCRAFAVDRALDGAPLTGGDLWIEEGDPAAEAQVVRSARVGVAYAGSYWSRRRFRLSIARHRAVSRSPNS